MSRPPLRRPLAWVIGVAVLMGSGSLQAAAPLLPGIVPDEGANSDLLDLVRRTMPDSPIMVMQLRPRAITETPLIQPYLNAEAAWNPLTEVSRKLLKPEQMVRVIASAGVDSEGIVLCQANGPIDVRALLTRRERPMLYHEHLIEGRRVFVAAEDAPWEPAFCQYDKSSVMIGNEQDLRDVLTRQRPARLSESMVTQLERIPSARHVAMAIDFRAIPEELQPEIDDMFGEAFRKQIFAKVQGLRFEYDLGTSLVMRLSVSCSTEADAADLTQAANLTLGLVKLGGMLPEEVAVWTERMRFSAHQRETFTEIQLNEHQCRPVIGPMFGLHFDEDGNAVNLFADPELVPLEVPAPVLEAPQPPEAPAPVLEAPPAIDQPAPRIGDELLELPAIDPTEAD